MRGFGLIVLVLFYVSFAIPASAQQSVGVADLIGVWLPAPVVVDRSGMREKYTLSADGTYTYIAWIFSGTSSFTEEHSGTFGFADGRLVFQGWKSGPRRYWITGWDQAADGTTTLSVRDDQCGSSPVCVAHWVRAAR